MTDTTRISNRYVSGFKIALLASVALAGSAMAQETQSSTPNETTRTTQNGEDTIVVTARNYVPSGSMSATKTDAPLIETPQSVSVINRDQIDLLNFSDVQQAVRYTSGVVGENYGPDLRYDFLTIRGFTPIQYIDGVQAPISATIPNVGVDLYGFEAIDILKGPSSVMYGTVPPGGIYNLTSRRPSFDFGGEVAVQYGSPDYKQIRGTLTGPLADGIAVRLTGLYLDRGSQVDYVNAQRSYIAPAVTVRPFSGTEITISGYHQYDRVNGDTNGFLPAAGTLLPNPLGEVPIGRNLGEPNYNFYKRNQWAVGYQLRQQLWAGFRFEQNVKWFDYSEIQNVIYGAGLGADNRTVSRFNFPYKEDVKEFAIDNRIQGKFNLGAVENRLTVGLDYRNFRNDSAFGFAVASSIDLFNPVYGAGGAIVTPGFSPFSMATRKQTGVYVQDQAKFGGFVLTLAGRQDWIDTQDRRFNTSTKDDKFTYRVGANYVFENGFAPYISYATSFVPVAGADRTGKLFVPSTGNQIEGGIKYEHGASGDPVRIFATAAVFQIKQENIPTLDTSAGAGPTDQIQLGQVTSEGIEIEGVARIRDQLSINGSYSYIDARVSKSNTPGELGKKLPTQPEHKFSLFVDYTLQTGPLGGLGFGVGGRHLSSSFGDNANVYRMPATTLFDAIIHYDLPSWRFSVNGSNIFDKKYVGRCSGPVGCIYGQRLQVVGTITRKF